MRTIRSNFDAQLLIAIVAGLLIVVLGVRFALHHAFTILGFAILGTVIFCQRITIRDLKQFIDEIQTDTSHPKSWRVEKDDR